MSPSLVAQLLDWVSSWATREPDLKNPYEWYDGYCASSD